MLPWLQRRAVASLNAFLLAPQIWPLMTAVSFYELYLFTKLLTSVVIAFSALTLLVVRQARHPACKN